jgi:NAD(P)-dependent dehydrogenase (short-subunit alcohol dehydrogenase family)
MRLCACRTFSARATDGIVGAKQGSRAASENGGNGGKQMPDRGFRLDGRIAVVTGAAGVIGIATMRLLAERGARIVAVDRLEREVQAAIADLPSSAQALAVAADVTREDEVDGYVRAAVDKFGTIDVFYNNAGVEGEITRITKYPLEAFRKVIDVNVIGVFLGPSTFCR